jgi:cysteine desulfurase
MTIYLDYQATTPIAPEVRGAMLPWMADKCANPHSAHVLGREAAAIVELAREAVAALLPKGGKVYFTSGATEALNWALRGFGSGGIVFAETEHAAVRDTALWLRSGSRKVTHLPVNRDGLLEKSPAFPQKTGLVAAMLVNNEIGVIHDIGRLAKAAHEVGAIFLCDAVQGFGRVSVPNGPDLIAISAHKIHGPKGIGALWIKDGVSLEPFMLGGGQEGGLRSGTLSPALCAGFGTAATLSRLRQEEDAAHVSALWGMALDSLPQGWQINGSATKRYFGNLNIMHEAIDSARLISEVRGVAFSSGSACASGSGRPSHVLKALGLSTSQAKGSIRLGFGRYTTESELREGLNLIFTAARSQCV